MIRVESTVAIKRDAAEVFAYIADPTNNPEWQGGMQEAKVTSAGAWGEGSTYQQVASFLGRRIESNFLIVEFEPGRLIKGTTLESSFPITFTRIVDRVGEGAQVTSIVEGDASGFFRVAAPLMRMMVSRSIAKDYANLKRILEAS